MEVAGAIKKTIHGVRITVSDVIAGSNHDFMFFASKIESLEGNNTESLIPTNEHVHVQMLTSLSGEEMSFLRQMKFVKHKSPADVQRETNLREKIALFQMEKKHSYQMLLNQRLGRSDELDFF